MANYELVSSNILTRVFMIKYGNNSGSSFTVDVDNKQYLISAKHFLSTLKESDDIEIFHNSRWEKLTVKRIFLKNPNIDIVVMAPSRQLSPSYYIEPSIANIIISQNVFFLGFPLNIYDDVKEFNNYFPLPLVKKGIISMLFNDNNKDVKMIYIDGHNNPGFSGGPIVCYDLKDPQKLKVIGVVSGYRLQEGAVYDSEKATALKIFENSGILIGYTIDYAIDAIKSNPIGVEIKP